MEFALEVPNKLKPQILYLLKKTFNKISRRKNVLEKEFLLEYSLCFFCNGGSHQIQ